MKHLVLWLIIFFGFAPNIPAWDGFEADSTDLVEITPDRVPAPGDTIEVKNYDQDSTQTCYVESVKRNRRTVEVVIKTPDGNTHTLVMEGR